MKSDTALRVLVLWLVGSTAQAHGPAPHPRLSPEAVVRIQLDALRDNDVPVRDAGISTVFEFASPPNRARTGPLARFARMIHGSYADLLGHREAHLFKTQREEGQTILPVEVVSRDGIHYRYLFILRQYDLPQGRCWLTDSVVGKSAEVQRSAAWMPRKLALE